MSGASPKICLKGLVSKDSWTAKNAFFKEANQTIIKLLAHYAPETFKM